jgi:hypothetical protein
VTRRRLLGRFRTPEVRLIAVRRPATAPVHLANAVDVRTFSAVCGATFRGDSAVRPIREWDDPRERHCRECAEASVVSRGNLRRLALIAGW